MAGFGSNATLRNVRFSAGYEGEEALQSVFHVKLYCWLPGDLQERSEQDRAPYAAWAKLGFIASIGPTTDPRAIAHKIGELNGQNRIMSLAFDRWRVNDLKRELDAIGCLVPLEPHGQGYKDMSPAVDIVERLEPISKLLGGVDRL